MNARTIKLEQVEKKYKTFKRKASDLIQGSELALQKDEVVNMIDCLPTKKELLEPASKLRAALMAIQAVDCSLIENIAEAMSDSPYENVAGLFLVNMEEFCSTKCMTICIAVICYSMLFDPSEYETADSDQSSRSSDDESIESSEQPAQSRPGAVAAMSNELYRKVCTELGFEKLSAIYCIKLYCNWLYRFDFSLANVDLNRFVGDSTS